MQLFCHWAASLHERCQTDCHLATGRPQSSGKAKVRLRPQASSLPRPAMEQASYFCFSVHHGRDLATFSCPFFSPYTWLIRIWIPWVLSFFRLFTINNQMCTKSPTTLSYLWTYLFDSQLITQGLHSVRFGFQFNKQLLGFSLFQFFPREAAGPKFPAKNIPALRVRVQSRHWEMSISSWDSTASVSVKLFGSRM